MYKVKVYVQLRESILDPQGKAVKNSLHSMNYTEVQDVRIGKYIELFVDEINDQLEDRVKQMCERVLSNPVMEDVRYEVEEVIPS